MRFTDFLADLVDFGKRDESGNILVKDGMQGTAISRLNVEEIALFSVIDLVASTAAMCEWRTYQNGQYQRGEDWFRWNVEPNQNENAFFFRRLLFARLLRFNEALVFQRADGSLYLADSFSREEFAFKPNKYSGITCNGLMVSSYKTEDEVFYFHLASQDTASLLRRFNSLYSEALAEALDKYKHSGGRSGVLKITGNATKDKNYEENVGIYNVLRRCGATVVAYIDGVAASAASVIAMAADKVIMPRNTAMMVHNAAWGVYGNSKELRKSADDLDIINGAMLQSYIVKAGDKLPAEKLEELTDGETWLSAEMCIQYGLADEYAEQDADLTAAAKQYQGARAAFQSRDISTLPAAMAAAISAVAGPQEPPKPQTPKASEAGCLNNILAAMIK